MHFSKSFVLIGSIALIAACSQTPSLIKTANENNDQAQAVLGGSLKTDFALSTNFVIIVADLDGSQAAACTGVVLSKRTVLTAAYCTPDNSQAIYVVKESKLVKKTLKAQLKSALRPGRVTFHPNFLKAFLVDGDEKTYMRGDALAVLHFTKDLPANFTPVALPAAEVSLAVGDEVTVAGFGVDRSAAAYGVVQVLDPNFGSSKVLLSQSPLNGSCFGDGGGPAFVTRKGNSVLVAVAGYQNVLANHSYNAQEAKNCTGGGVFFRIDNKENLAWLKSEINKK